MVFLREMAEDSFVMVQADWTAGQARQLIERLWPTHVIVHRVESFGEFYYLYTVDEALDRLRSGSEEWPVRVALNLHESDATPRVDAYADGEETPDRCVVVEDGDVIGFYDLSVPPSFGVPGAKGPDRGELESAGPTPRSLVAELAEKVNLGQTVSLLVYLSAEMETLPQSLPHLPVSVPRGSAVDVVVQAKRGFELVELTEGSIAVVDAEETLPLQFKLKATELGRGKIRVLAFHRGQPLGALTLAPEVVEKAEEVGEETQFGELEIGPISVHQPDLSLLILESVDAGHMALTLRLTARDPSLGLQFAPYGPLRFEMSPAQYFAEFFKGIDSLQVNTPEKRRIAEERLSAKGAELFETLIPQDLQVLLWSLKQRIKTVQILSEEPWIPWELCKLLGEEDGLIVEGPFLCEAFSVTRWMPGLEQKPELSLNKMGVVVPKESALEHAPDERDYLKGLEGGGREVEIVEASFLTVRSKLALGTYDGWHFTGHGTFRGDTPDQSAMLLDNREKLTPEDLSGRIRNLGRARPLVFLNACEIGQGAMSLTDVGGWSAKFLRAGAAAFIGAYWSIFDRSAFDFAQAFYRHLLSEGKPIGEAVQTARLDIRAEGDPTWLAYTVFADPLATVRPPA